MAEQTAGVVCVCVFLLCAGLHFVTGEVRYISGSPGESVLLPCSDGDSQPTDVQWRHSDLGETQTSAHVMTDQRYKGRVQIHGNLSLSISQLTLDDSGSYWCTSTEIVNLIIEADVAVDVPASAGETSLCCSISGNESSVAISRYPGESVFLSCSVRCSARGEAQFRWNIQNREINQTTNSNDLNRLYQGRIHMFDIPSGNLSLLISSLTEKDEGLYLCWINENRHKSFSLTVKGCTLWETERKPKTKYPGDSVLLPCSCKDPKTKPESFKWTRLDSSGIELSIETLRNTTRVHTFHRTTPSNLSLLISNLTEDDQGTYRCVINDTTSTYNLTVAGCVLSKHHISRISYAGENVTLPCFCEDPKTKPKHIEWKRAALNETLVSDADDINGRFQILRDSPHNLSLRISNLTEADGGLYVCVVNGKQSRSINLTVTDFSLNYLIFSLVCLMLLLMTGFLCWRFTRAKKRRTESRETQSPDHQDDVTYSTVTQINRGKPTENQQRDDVIYLSVAQIKGEKRTRRKDDVTYSSVICRSHTPRSPKVDTEEATVYASVQTDKT